MLQWSSFIGLQSRESGYSRLPSLSSPSLSSLSSPSLSSLSAYSQQYISSLNNLTPLSAVLCAPSPSYLLLPLIISFVATRRDVERLLLTMSATDEVVVKYFTLLDADGDGLLCDQGKGLSDMWMTLADGNGWEHGGKLCADFSIEQMLG